MVCASVFVRVLGVIGRFTAFCSIIYSKNKFCYINMFRVYTTASFDRVFSRLSSKEQNIVKKLFTQVRNQPFVGKPLGFRFLREKKVKGKRVYFLVYEDLLIVLLVAISDKKGQQETIDRIKLRLQAFKEFVKRIT